MNTVIKPTFLGFPVEDCEIFYLSVKCGQCSKDFLLKKLNTDMITLNALLAHGHFINMQNEKTQAEKQLEKKGYTITHLLSGWILAEKNGRKYKADTVTGLKSLILG